MLKFPTRKNSFQTTYKEDCNSWLTYMQKKSSCQKGEPLAVTNFFIIDCISFADLVQCILSYPTCLLEVIMSREGAVDIPEDHLITGAVLGEKSQETEEKNESVLVEVSLCMEIFFFILQCL